MSDKELLDDLRTRFDEIATDIPDSAAIKARLGPLTRPRRRVPFVAAALILVVAGLVSLAALRSTDPATVEIATASSSPGADVGHTIQPSGRPFSSTISGTPIDLVLPELTNGRWSIETDTDSRVELLVVLDGVPSGAEPVLRLFTVPGLDSTEVGEQLLTGLFDTDMVARGAASLGESTGIEVELSSRQGTSRAAFRLGPATYVETVGINRRYLVRIFDRPSGAFIVWLDANDDSYRLARAEAARLEVGIDLGD